MSQPNPHKMAVTTWLAVYPLITLLLLIFEPVFQGVALPVRTLFLTTIMVPLLIYWIMPLATSHFRSWLAS